MTGNGMLVLASATFVGTHFLMSHPLRAPLVAKLGERGFTAVYSLVALATFGWMIHAYGPASAEAPQLLWESGEAEWLAATLLMWLGSILFLGSLRRNPALPRPGRPIERIDEPRGVFAITRHPDDVGIRAVGGGPCDGQSDPRQRGAECRDRHPRAWWSGNAGCEEGEAAWRSLARLVCADEFSSLRQEVCAARRVRVHHRNHCLAGGDLGAWSAWISSGGDLGLFTLSPFRVKAPSWDGNISAPTGFAGAPTSRR